MRRDRNESFETKCLQSVKIFLVLNFGQWHSGEFRTFYNFELEFSSILKCFSHFEMLLA